MIDEVSMPKKLSKGQVLVKIFYSGICGSQLGEIIGTKGMQLNSPKIRTTIIIIFISRFSHIKRIKC